MLSRVKLKGFSFMSSTALPDAFILCQDELEKVVLVAPGLKLLVSDAGLLHSPNSSTFQLNLTGRAPRRILQ
jgi:hypothetical protein